MSNINHLDAFVRGYLTCALSTGTDESSDCGGDPLDMHYDISDFAPEAVAKAVEECAEFRAANEHLLDRAGDDDQNGIDLWFSRNGHGAGYFDRDFSEGIGDLLQEAASACGERHVTIGDDGKLYIEQG